MRLLDRIAIARRIARVGGVEALRAGIADPFEQFRRLGRRMREVPDTAAAAALLSARFDELLAMGLEAPERAALYERLARNIRAHPPMSGKLRREDWPGALVSGLLVIATTLPAAIPFAVVDDAYTAMRASNAVAIVLLFVAGWAFGRVAEYRPWLTAVAMVVLGIALVALTIALGG